MTIYELQEYCNANSARPENIHGPFIVGSNIADDGSHFIVVWSTTALIKLQNVSKLICVDGTYKLTTDGYPCLVWNFCKERIKNLNFRGLDLLIVMGASTPLSSPLARMKMQGLTRNFSDSFLQMKMDQFINLIGSWPTRIEALQQVNLPQKYFL